MIIINADIYLKKDKNNNLTVLQGSKRIKIINIIRNSSFKKGLKIDSGKKESISFHKLV